MRRRNHRLLLWLGAILLAASACSSGCVRREAVIVPQGDPVQLAKDVKATVWVETEPDGVRVQMRATIPAGWWALPDPGDDPTSQPGASP